MNQVPTAILRQRGCVTNEERTPLTIYDFISPQPSSFRDAGWRGSHRSRAARIHTGHKKLFCWMQESAMGR
jgi:hypothetical protein